MRTATVVLAATLLVGTQAVAIVPRSETATSLAETETTTETVKPTVEAIEGTPTSTTETTESATPVEAATVETPVYVTDAACALSTVPHSEACLKKWFHAAGCLNRELPADRVQAWSDNADVSAVESGMASMYDAATGADATADDQALCAPLPKPIMEVLDCVDTVVTDVCADCVSFTKVFGVDLPKINGTCLAECFNTQADVLAPSCPNLSQGVTCHETLKKTCGKCMKKKGQLLGIHMFDVDDDCFEACYWAHKEEIRSSCPLPEPLKKAIDCHKALAEVCGDECVGDDHEVDIKCLDGCFTEKSAQNETLKEVCPAKLTQGLTTLAEVKPSDDEIEMELEGILSNIDLPFNFETIKPMLEGVFAQFVQEGMGPDGGHHHDDDEHEDEDGHPMMGFMSQLLNGNSTDAGDNVEALLNGFMQQFASAGSNHGHGHHQETTTSTETATATETDGDDGEEVETSSSAIAEPTETDADDTTESIETESDVDNEWDSDSDDDEDDLAVAATEQNPLFSFLQSWYYNLVHSEQSSAADVADIVTTSTIVESATATEPATETSTHNATNA